MDQILMCSFYIMSKVSKKCTDNYKYIYKITKNVDGNEKLEIWGYC